MQFFDENLFSNFWKIIMFQVYESLSHWNFLKLEIRILDILLKQWNGFEDFNILNVSKILLKFAMFSKFFKYFCPFLSLTIFTGQRSFSSLADGLLSITASQRIILNIFFAKSGSFLLNFAIFCKFSKYQFIYLQKRLENKVAESNQAKASLTKPWLATDEANRSPVVWKQFARR